MKIREKNQHRSTLSELSAETEKNKQKHFSEERREGKEEKGLR